MNELQMILLTGSDYKRRIIARSRLGQDSGILRSSPSEQQVVITGENRPGKVGQFCGLGPKI